MPGCSNSTVKSSCSIAILSLIWVLSGCGKDEAAVSAITLSGDPWVPNVAGSGAANHDSSVVVSKEVLTTQTGPVVGHSQGWNGKEITVTLDMSQDLGAYGSLSLVAQTVGFPSALEGGAYAVLTSLSDGTHEFINLARQNTGGDCAESGAYVKSGSSYVENSACSVSWPSAYLDRTHWEQRQIDYTFNSYASTNTFPTCNWAEGTSTSPGGDPQCAFNSTFFDSGKLRTGTYTAKYVLMSDSYATLTGYNASLMVTVIKKSRNVAVNSGAIDLNVVFVGASVSQASRNAKGKINLDSLFKAVQDYYSQTNVNVKLGTIRTFEWLDGESYAEIATSDFGKMISAASSVLPAETDGKAINIFFVNSVTDMATLLGISGGINGPMLNGLANSGVLVSTFGKLDQFNPNCSSAPCDVSQIEYDFNDLGQTVAHEMGHYLGLNHPSESTGDSTTCFETRLFAPGRMR